MQDSTVRNCFTECDVTGGSNVGGICGGGYNSIIGNSYSTGPATGGIHSGGICGSFNYGTIRNCYAVGPVDYGICGYSEDCTFGGCFWDGYTCGTWSSYGGLGRTTQEMQMSATFTDAGWDFFYTWYMNGYPELSSCCYGDSFERWVAAEWVLVDQRGESDTPADDGIPNLLKYACGLSATSAYTPQDLMTMSIDPVTGVFSIEYLRSKSAEGVLLEPIWTPALTLPDGWTTDDITDEPLDPDQDPEFELWKASIPYGPSGFMRLRATPVDELP